MMPLVPATSATSSSIFATVSYDPTSVPMLKFTAPSGSTMVRAVEVSSAVVSVADSPAM